MVTIRLQGKLTEDRRLIVDVPESFPSGDIEVTLELKRELDVPNNATSLARAKLAAAGALSAVWKAPEGFIPTEEDDELIELPPGSPTLDQMIDEDRGAR